MKWEHPPLIKIYEALGSIADKRIKILGNSAKVFSSSGRKFYTVTYEPASQAIMVNDNGSFYKGYLGYPAIAFLMLIGELEYSSAVAAKLKGISWKDLNQKFKNDFDKTLGHILSTKPPEEKIEIEEAGKRIDAQLRTKSYSLLGTKVLPPEGY